MSSGLINVMIFLLIFTIAAVKGDPVLVTTDRGPVLGIRRHELDTRTGKNVTWIQFSAIPYAAPPVGELRFRAPEPPKVWTQPPDPYSPRKICPQISLGSLYPRSDEDCLYLYVHVPDQDDQDNLLPVMVWIHGGAYMSGDGTPDSFGPLYFMNQGVIMITINYRLGPLGFLSLGNNDIPGNMGQRDQVAALHWIQNNVHLFGGDKSQVTIFGQSAGANAAMYHLYSPLSQGLFTRVIAQSGVGGLAPSFHHHQEADAIRYGNNAALLLGCILPENRAQCLREKDVYTIQSMDIPMELISQPNVDTSLSNPYLPISPLDCLESGNYLKDVEIMLGYNEDDGVLITQFFVSAPSLYDFLKASWRTVGPFALFQQHHTEISDEEIVIATEILNQYIDNAGVESLNPDNFWNITDMFTDSFFGWPNYLFLKHHLDYSTRNTFQYRFSYDGEYHRCSAPGLHHDNCPGVIHSDELYFLWNPYYNVSYELNDKDVEISFKLIKLWTNFAKTGDPNYPVDPEISVTWKGQNSENRMYMRINSVGEFNMELGEDYLKRASIWEDTMEKYNYTFGINENAAR